VEGLTSDIAEVQHQIDQERKAAVDAEIRKAEGEYQERVKAVVSTVKRLSTQIIDAENSRRKILALGRQTDSAVPVWLAQAVNRAGRWWEDHHVRDGSRPRRSFEEQSRIDGLANAEHQLATQLALLKNARKLGKQEPAEAFRKKVQHWRSEVARLGGDPEEIAPAEELALPARAGIVQRVTYLPQQLAKRINWSEKLPV